ncbi:MAG: sugar phosphate nucleotidyltransferase [Chloroflexota bacterium]
MKITKAVITAAGANQRTLPLQTLIDRDGQEKSVLSIIIEETLHAGMDNICVVIQPGDEDAYRRVAGDHAGWLQFATQEEPLGHGHAVYCARDFVGDEPFLHLVGDHLYVNRGDKRCAQYLVEVAEAESCAVSAVQATRENLLPYYGTVSARRITGQSDLYQIESVVEKPTPTQAEQRLFVPGLRAGYYLCFFGMHVLTPTVFSILEPLISHLPHFADHSTQNGTNGTNRPSVTLSDALNELAHREQYLALEQQHDTRYDVGVKYGLLTAQVALAMSGQDRDEVLTTLLTLLAQRELSSEA